MNQQNEDDEALFAGDVAYFTNNTQPSFKRAAGFVENLCSKQQCEECYFLKLGEPNIDDLTDFLITYIKTETMKKNDNEKTTKSQIKRKRQQSPREHDVSKRSKRITM